MRITLCLLAVLCLTGADWLQFRGTDHTGAAPGASPPTRFDEKENRDNIAWKAKLPGRGVSGPIVVKGRVIVTASSGFRRDRLYVVCFDANTGDQVWERQFWATGRTFCHPSSANAAPTPCSDGRRIFAFFSSGDLFCLDLDGNLQWLRGLGHDFPAAGNDVGMSSSPVVADGTVIVQMEAQGDSFAAGIDAASGATRWRHARPEMSNWASPTTLRGRSAGGDLVLMQSSEAVEALQPRTGEAVWKHNTECSSIPSIITDGKTIYVPTNGLTAFRANFGSRDNPRLWSENRLGPSSPSPVIRDGRLYVLKGSILVCGDASTGKVLWQLRVKGRRFWATPVVAGKHIFLANDDGLVQVVDVAGKEGQLVASNALGQAVFGTPAIADAALYVRSHETLWKIAE